MERRGAPRLECGMDAGNRRTLVSLFLTTCQGRCDDEAATASVSPTTGDKVPLPMEGAVENFDERSSLEK